MMFLLKKIDDLRAREQEREEKEPQIPCLTNHRRYMTELAIVDCSSI